MNQDQIDRAAEALFRAWRGEPRLDGLPDGCRPETLEESYAIQEAFAARAGAVRGWKVGAPDAEATPRRAPLMAAVFQESPGSARAEKFSLAGLEAELAFRLDRDLPPRAEPYSEDEVIDALGTLHAAIEILDTRYTDWSSMDPLSRLADFQSHGGFVLGEGIEDWRELALDNVPLVMTVNGAVVADVVGGNPAGDPLRLVHWLANDLSERGRGMKAGDVITTGSCTGIIYHDAPAKVEATFDDVGAARFTLEA